MFQQNFQGSRNSLFVSETTFENTWRQNDFTITECGICMLYIPVSLLEVCIPLNAPNFQLIIVSFVDRSQDF